MPQVASFDALLLFTTGIAISLGHCVGMCGPLMLLFARIQGEGRGGRWALLPSLLIYHTGRILAYGAIGLGLGLIGAATHVSSGQLLVQGVLSMVVGLLMLLMGLSLHGLLPMQRRIESGPLGERIGIRIRSFLHSRGIGGRFLLGVANGFLPCGPVYAVAFGALAAASPLRGALAMLIFGLGTLPVLLVLLLLGGRLGAGMQRRFRHLGAFLVLLIGAQLLLRGAAALAWLPHLNLGRITLW